MFDKRVLLLYTFATIVVAMALLGSARGEPGHPQRPEKFTSEEQLRKYLRELKQYYEDNVRIGRFGKRNYLPPAMMHMKSSYPKKHEEPEWKNEYDYYTQFNI